jgi:hypothetical protein
MNDQQMRVWRTLSTCSRRAMRKTKTKQGYVKNYRPQGNLLIRVMRDENLSKTQAYKLLQEIRKIVIQEFW